MTDAVEHPRASFASLPAETLVDIRKHVPNLIGYVHFSQICKASWDICDEVFWKTVCTAAGYGLPNVPIKCEGQITINEHDPRYKLLVDSTPHDQSSPSTACENPKSACTPDRTPVRLPLISEMTGTYANLARCVVANGISLSKQAMPELQYEHIFINEVVNGTEAAVADAVSEPVSSAIESDDVQAEPGSSSFEFHPWPEADLGFLVMYKTSPSHFFGLPAFNKPYFTCRFATEQPTTRIHWDVAFPQHKEPLKSVGNSRGIVWADILPQAYADVKAWEAKRDARTLEVQQRLREGGRAVHATRQRAANRWLSYEAHCRFMGIEYNDPKRRPVVRASWGYR